MLYECFTSAGNTSNALLIKDSEDKRHFVNQIPWLTLTEVSRKFIHVCLRTKTNAGKIADTASRGGAWTPDSLKGGRSKEFTCRKLMNPRADRKCQRGEVNGWIRPLSGASCVGELWFRWIGTVTSSSTRRRFWSWASCRSRVPVCARSAAF